MKNLTGFLDGLAVIGIGATIIFLMVMAPDNKQLNINIAFAGSFCLGWVGGRLMWLRDKLEPM